MNKEIKPALLLTSFIILTHLSYVSNGFVWLDHMDITEKAAVIPLDQWYKAFLSNYGFTGFYRPIISIIHSVNAHVFGENAVYYHLLNLLFHIMVSGLAVVFISIFSELKRTEKYLVYLIVGVHSVSWFTVGAIAHLPELLMTLFTMATVVIYAKGGNGWVMTLSAVLALFSKETSLVYIPTFILLWYMVLYQAKIVKKRKGVSAFFSGLCNKRSFLIGGVLAGYLILRFNPALQLWKAQATSLSFSRTVGTRVYVIGRLLGNLISPFSPSNSDSVTIIQIVDWRVLLTLIVLCGLALVVRRLGFKHGVSLSLLMLAVALSPSLNIVPLPRFYSINYVYFATIPFAFLVISFLKMLSQKKGVYRLNLLILGIWLIIMSISTFNAGFRLKNDEELFLPAVKADNSFLEGHFYLGNYYFAQKDFETAKGHYQAALSANPTQIVYVDKRATAVNLAGIYVIQNQLNDASMLLNQASIGASGKQSAYIAYNRALIHARKGNPAEVVAILNPFIDRSLHINSLLLWSEALVRLGNKKLAVETIKQKLSRVSYSDQKILQQWLDTNNR